jgi:recombinational DNA repair protein (RecF pathway)
MIEKNSKCACCGKAISDVEYIRYAGLCSECWYKEDQERKKKERAMHEFSHRGNKITESYNIHTKEHKYNFYLMDEDYDTYDFGPFDSLEEAKEVMDELLDDVDSPYLRED